MNAPATFASRLPGAAATAALFLLATSAAAQQNHRTEQHFAVQGKPVVTVQNPSGRIVVKAWDKPEVMVVATHNSSNVNMDAEQAGNRIQIATELTGTNPGPRPCRPITKSTYPHRPSCRSAPTPATSSWIVFTAI